MIFVDGSAIAMATNHTLTLNTETKRDIKQGHRAVG